MPLFGVQQEQQVLEVSASTDIKVPRAEVWALIKPPENAVLLDPRVQRAFHVPGTPYGVGEMQGYIFRVDGRRHVSLIEVLEEIEGELAITSPVGGDDDASRAVYLLKETPRGTRLEMRTRFTVPAAQHGQAGMIKSAYQATVDQLVARVKEVAENGWNGLS